MHDQRASKPTPPIPHDPDYYVDQQAQIEYNLKSLIALPWEACPWPAVRLALLRLAVEGAELYAYTHGPYGDGTVEWVIWHRQPRPDVEARFTPEQWAIQYRYLTPAASGQEEA